MACASQALPLHMHSAIFRKAPELAHTTATAVCCLPFAGKATEFMAALQTCYVKEKIPKRSFPSKFYHVFQENKACFDEFGTNFSFNPLFTKNEIMCISFA